MRFLKSVISVNNHSRKTLCIQKLWFYLINLLTNNLCNVMNLMHYQLKYLRIFWNFTSIFIKWTYMLYLWYYGYREKKNRNFLTAISTFSTPKIISVLKIHKWRWTFLCYMYRSNAIYGYPMHWSFWDAKSEYCCSKISKLCHCDHNCASFILLVHHNIEFIPTNN